MYLLDTNVISELRKPRCDANVKACIGGLPVNSLYISAETVLEIEIGILAINKDLKQAKMLRLWFDDHVLPSFESRIIPIDTKIALQCARLHVPDRKSDRDAWIAASALVHSMIVITRNTADFEGTGVKLINPWLEKTMQK